jgi:hypothetical protein
MLSCVKTFAIALIGSLISLSLFSGCGTGQTVPGIKGFSTGVVSKNLYLSFTSTTLKWDEGVTLPIPGLSDSTVSVTPDLMSSGTVFQFSISLDSLLKATPNGQLSGLPGGTPLPGVVSGELPRWDAEIHNLTVSLYLSSDAFGVFIPLKFMDQAGNVLGQTVSVPIEDEHGNRLGAVSAIPDSQASGSGGVFVLLPYLGGQPRPQLTLNRN